MRGPCPALDRHPHARHLRGLTKDRHSHIKGPPNLNATSPRGIFFRRCSTAWLTPLVCPAAAHWVLPQHNTPLSSASSIDHCLPAATTPSPADRLSARLPGSRCWQSSAHPPSTKRPNTASRSPPLYHQGAPGCNARSARPHFRVSQISTARFVGDEALRLHDIPLRLRPHLQTLASQRPNRHAPIPARAAFLEAAGFRFHYTGVWLEYKVWLYPVLRILQHSTQQPTLIVQRHLLVRALTRPAYRSFSRPPWLPLALHQVTPGAAINFSQLHISSPSFSRCLLLQRNISHSALLIVNSQTWLQQ